MYIFCKCKLNLVTVRAWHGKLDVGMHYIYSRYPAICRYNGRRSTRTISATPEENRLWQTVNGSTHMIGKAIRLIMSKKKQPLCVVVGHRSMRKRYGHALTLVLVQEGREVLAFVKDSLHIKEATLKTHVYGLLKHVPVRKVTLVGCLDSEENITFTDCLREAYRVVADVLDGNYFWELKIDAFKRIYDVKAKKEVAIHDEMQKKRRRQKRLAVGSSPRK